MTTHKKWIKLVFLTSFILLSLIVLFNYLINPYGVFSRETTKGINHIKDNTISAELSKFYYAKRENPNLLMIGTSRVEHINPKYLKKYSNKKVFNLGIKGAGISTQYNMIKYFVGNTEVKTIILGLDFFSFNPASMTNYKNISHTRYNNYFLNDYKDALLGFRTFRKSIKTLKDNLKNKTPRVDNSTGWDSYDKAYNDLKIHGDDWLKEKIASHFPNFGIDKLFFDNEAFKDKESIDEGLELLNEIIVLCHNNNVELKIFTTPIYYKIYDVIQTRGYQNTYDYWKKNLSKYGIIHDFNYKNSITKDFRNYIDASHYQTQIGKLILAKLYNDPTQHVPKDFGKILKPIGNK